jgi:hypothetical protein
MILLYHIANTLVLPPAMFFAWNFYKFRKAVALRRHSGVIPGNKEFYKAVDSNTQ